MLHIKSLPFSRQAQGKWTRRASHFTPNLRDLSETLLDVQASVKMPRRETVRGAQKQGIQVTDTRQINEQELSLSQKITSFPQSPFFCLFEALKSVMNGRFLY